MKKAMRFILATVLLCLVIAPMAVSAFTAVGNINVPYGTPTIDGVLDQGEWSERNKIKIDSESVVSWSGSLAEGMYIDFYYTWDTTNLYFAANIIDSTFAYSTSGYNADAFQISLNVAQVFTSDNPSDRAIFYSWGCMENGNVTVVRQESSNNGDITNCGKSTKTDDGWSFEIAIPWTTLVEDAELKSEQTLPAVAAGMKIDALICYLDRDAADGTLLSASGTCNTGEAMGWHPTAHGITLTLLEEATAQPAEDTTAAPAEDTTAAPAETAGDTTAPVATTPPAAQTSDIGILLAALVAAPSALAFISLKKKR